MLQTPIQNFKNLSNQQVRILEQELGVITIEDILNLYPNKHIDRSDFHSINDLKSPLISVQIKGYFRSLKKIKQKRGYRLEAQFYDDTDFIQIIWFKKIEIILSIIKPNVLYVVFGKCQLFNQKMALFHPEITSFDKFQYMLNSKIQPVYPSGEKLIKTGLTNRWFINTLNEIFKQWTDELDETLPSYLLKKYRFPERKQALLGIHFPKNLEELNRSKWRLKFEELFYTQIQFIIKKQQRKAKIKGHELPKIGKNFNHFYAHILPFELTHAQKRVLKEIRSDLRRPYQMNRLLQGDVGSGKTIVALMTMLIAIDNGFQTSIVAPTEILATQHFHSISELVSKLSLKVRLLTGSTKKSDRQIIKTELENGTLDILVGTHAVFQEQITFKNLGLAVIDEQHRFGVKQRSTLWRKSVLPPHILVMSATPIPRTLAMSLYGDLDISLIDALPPNRKPIKTTHKYDSNRLSVFKFIKEEIAKGRQIYIVYPLIEESKTLDYNDLMDGYNSITRAFQRPTYEVSILHGNMKTEDKNYEIERFQKGITQIMVATTVIEVGVNIPNASVMIIESAERFGLSQLHQLRGRVGRGVYESYCILLTSYKLSKEAKTRIETMTDTNDGFKVAEVDLKLRGPGDMMGTQQSGILNFKIADLLTDQDILIAARNEATRIIESDPELQKDEHLSIKSTLQKIQKHRSIWRYIS